MVAGDVDGTGTEAENRVGVGAARSPRPVEEATNRDPTTTEIERTMIFAAVDRRLGMRCRRSA